MIEKTLKKAGELKTRMTKVDTRNSAMDSTLTTYREKFDISYDRFSLMIGEEPSAK